ncbi:MAG: hypothetical protein IJ312_07585 [Treponema sp.]|nr:hypothetical protein [Treponema sp.]
MKKNIIIFLVILIINFLLIYLLYKYNIENFQKGDVWKLIILYLFSIFVYWFFFAIYYINEMMRKKNETSIVAVIFSAIVIIISLINVKSNPILFLPMMYMVSLFGISIYWQFFRK